MVVTLSRKCEEVVTGSVEGDSDMIEVLTGSVKEGGDVTDVLMETESSGKDSEAAEGEVDIGSGKIEMSAEMMGFLSLWTIITWFWS